MYVKSTAAIWQHIDSKASELFVDRSKDAADWFQYGHTLEEIRADTLSQLVSDEERAAIELLGSRFFPEVTKAIPVRVVFRLDEEPEQVHEESYSVELNIAMRLPSSWSGYYSSSHQKITEGLLPEIAARRYRAMKRVTEDRDQFIKSLESAYKNATSINQLIKAWPAIEEFLPAETIERVNRKVTRTKSDSLLDEEEAKNLSVHLLKAKVAK